MASWYYVVPKTREKSGPHDEAFVRSRFIAGDLSPATLVWHDGLVGWIRAEEAFAALQSPPAEAGKVPLPDGLRGWMGFVGAMTCLTFFLPAMFLYGFPMFLAGFAVLGARGALARTPYVDPDLLPFFAKLRTLFCCWGWAYLVGILLAALGLLAYAALALWLLSSGNENLPGLFAR